MVEYRIYADNNLLYVSTDPDQGALISPQLKLEVNKSGSLTFTIPPGHTYYNDIHPMTTTVTVYQGQEILFFGRVIEAVPDFYKQKKVSCEGALSFLLDTIMTPFTYDKKHQKTIKYVFDKIINNHNNNLIDMINQGKEQWKLFNQSDAGNYSVTVTVKSNSSVNDTDYWKFDSYGDTLSTLTSELVDVYGGILRTRHTCGTVGDYRTIRNLIDYIKDPSQNPSGYSLNDQTIEFGVNLLDFESEYPTDDIFTALLPIGNDKLTISKVNNGDPYLYNQAAVAKFGKICKVQEWSSIKKPEKLLEKAQRYMAQHTKVHSDNLKVKAIDLHHLTESTSSLKLLDRVKVYSEPHGIGTDSNMILTCLSAEYDLQNPENNSYLLGTYIPEYKDKTELPKKSSKRSSGRRGGGGTGAPSLTDMQTGTTQNVQETIDEIVDDKTNTTKDFLAIMGDKVADFLGVNIPDSIKNVVSKKLDWLYEKIGVGNSEGDNGVEIPDLLDLVESGVGTFKETLNETTGKWIPNKGIKTLSDVTDDIVEINGREIHIGNADGSTSDISIRAQKIDITGALETFIGGYKIVIGEGKNTEQIVLDSKEIVLTGAIKDLIVTSLTTDDIHTKWLMGDYTISAKNLRAVETVYGSSFLRYRTEGATELLDPLVTIKDVYDYMEKYAVRSKNFYVIESTDTGDETVDRIVATQKWVEDQGYTSESWINTQDYASKSWVTDQHYTAVVENGYHYSTMNVKKVVLNGSDGKAYQFYVDAGYGG